MVDPNKDERTVETETRKVWITPHLETSSIAEDTLMPGSGNTSPDGGTSTS